VEALTPLVGVVSGQSRIMAGLAGLAGLLGFRCLTALVRPGRQLPAGTRP
jgi:hypothetical protein